MNDEIAYIVIQKYDQLPSKGKPLIRSNGVEEWTILAGIVIRNIETGKLECVSIATGVKAMPDAKVRTSNGRMLHDTHAEILVIRAFNRYVIDRGLNHIKEVYLYSSAPPCGDASMSLLNGGDSWEDGRSLAHEAASMGTMPEESPEGPMLRGRAHFNSLGRIRTKPGRSDSPLTMSKSCSDKLCLRQQRGLLLTPLRHIYDDRENATVFLTSLIGPVVPPDYERAFSRFNPVQRFSFGKTNILFPGYHPETGLPSPISLAWWQSIKSPEVISNGYLQGGKNRPSALSRYELTMSAKKVAPTNFESISLYYELKIQSKVPENWQRTARDDFDV